MEQKPRFNSAEQAVSVLWRVTARLTGLMTWLAIAVAHLLLLTLALLACWLSGTSATDASAAVLHMLPQSTAAMLGAVGVSVGTVLGLYWWLLRRLHRAIGGPLAGHLLRDAQDR